MKTRGSDVTVLPHKACHTGRETEHVSKARLAPGDFKIPTRLLTTEIAQCYQEDERCRFAVVQSAGTLQNLLPAATHCTCLQPMKNLIPVYNSDGSLYQRVSLDGLLRLQSAGLVAGVIRHRKGHVNRAILFQRTNAARPLSRSAYSGQRFSFETTSEHGRSWELRRLGGKRDDKTFAPSDVAPLFAAVVTDRIRGL